ncbi:hypothetical protein H112_07749 [Trichophyton rubrum D6]|uniref:Uncharacterized protein n=3 Tax=Trichophyton rubrum TaxID=5551 RepID=A0A178ETY1_TRIRU|nr:uncharacterized protein TERG_00347 [Trichophyton rubrum CBS 118892]EZF11024.1 hypothetical protein H100_07773 [Trichophyton rubrum MR850]EZF37898.1 hypothetical protein H102_07738 [Trichophyton rubrum CBS 100081]EZF48533.1 hypothetical protein H103_07761 [Trichophyton rubrum CBS 288.86]EZF59174.1 hypothetical protein H104_07710 [Trichophyton rubrum CBS 289.86]EZF80562.1 hypothetical protein H110_07759 [Trichophyton rubrum MR1448]EZF91254.1 hypothetical protein H113_07819 [Trichophyton rubr
MAEALSGQGDLGPAKKKIDDRHRFFRRGLKGTRWLGGMRAQVRKTESQVTSPPVCELSAFAFVLGCWFADAAYLVEKTAPPPMEVIRDKKREPTVPLELRPDRGARAADGVGRRMGVRPRTVECRA